MLLWWFYLGRPELAESFKEIMRHATLLWLKDLYKQPLASAHEKHQFEHSWSQFKQTCWSLKSYLCRFCPPFVVFFSLITLGNESCSTRKDIFANVSCNVLCLWNRCAQCCHSAYNIQFRSISMILPLLFQLVWSQYWLYGRIFLACAICVGYAYVEERMLSFSPESSGSYVGSCVVFDIHWREELACTDWL